MGSTVALLIGTDLILQAANIISMVTKNLQDLVFFHKRQVTFCSHVGTTHSTEFCLKASGTTMNLIHSKEACGYTVAAINQKLTAVDVRYTDSPRVSLTLLNLSCKQPSNSQ